MSIGILFTEPMTVVRGMSQYDCDKLIQIMLDSNVSLLYILEV